MRYFLLLIGILIASAAMAGTEIEQLNEAKDAMERKAQAEAMATVDEQMIDNIEINIRKANPPGPSDPSAVGLTLRLYPGDPAFTAVVDALKDSAAAAVTKAEEDLSDSGIVIEAKPIETEGEPK